MASTSLMLLSASILFIIDRVDGISCSAGTISCRSGTQCVNLGDVCRGGSQCSDGSDEDPEICSLWHGDPGCSSRRSHSSESFFCSKEGFCVNIQNFCSYGCQDKDERLCQIVRRNILKLKEDSGMVLTEDLVSLMEQSVNATSDSTSCPMFYNRVGEACLSFFAPAKVPWPEARQFCLSIGGDLIAFKGLVDQEKVLDYMKKSQLTSDYWIGGRFDVDTNSWSWVYDDTPMPMGSPFWATRYSSSCVPRTPPHADPYSPAPAALPGAPCFNYVLAPAKRESGWCAAITYEHYYYFIDDECQNNRSPLCLYIGKPRNKVEAKGDK